MWVQVDLILAKLVELNQRIMKSKTLSGILVLLLLMLTIPGCRQNPPAYYSLADFYKVHKTDVHFHYNSPDARFLLFADTLHMKIVSPNVDSGHPVKEQLEVSRELHKKYPQLYAFLGTFSLDGFGTPGFSDSLISQVRRDLEAGASGIKIWKNIGMSLKDASGKYVMADDAAFAPVFRYIEENNIPLMAHLGEPLNCWLPLDSMTLGNDRNYFSEHPEYHMYLHPEAPSYKDQINARDSLLRRYPGIRFTGAHLGSLEWSVDELAQRLDRYPQFDVDMSARIGHLQYQSLSDYDKVRSFMIRYSARILYGTDGSVSKGDSDYQRVTDRLKKTWLDQWIFLATDSVLPVRDLGGKPVKGLRLPAEVLNRIYHENAEKFFRE
jgi:predicted TIM-barrel fold metal-dependent hydrolase